MFPASSARLTSTSPGDPGPATRSDPSGSSMARTALHLPRRAARVTAVRPHESLSFMCSLSETILIRRFFFHNSQCVCYRKKVHENVNNFSETTDKSLIKKIAMSIIKKEKSFLHFPIQHKQRIEMGKITIISTPSSRQTRFLAKSYSKKANPSLEIPPGPPDHL